VPMQFHWTGEEFVVGCWPDDPKAVAICQNQTVALTIDTAEFPFRVLQVRGRARVSNLVAPSEEMLAASIRYMGPEAVQAWVDNISRNGWETASIAIRPEWVNVLDFESRFPRGTGRRMSAAV